MALQLYDGKLLLNGGALAAHANCCCGEPTDHCSFLCANSLELTLSGFFDQTCTIFDFFGNYTVYDYTYSSLNTTFSTTDISVFVGLDGTIEGIFHLGTWGSAVDKGIRVTRRREYGSDGRLGGTYDTYLYRLHAGLQCYSINGVEGVAVKHYFCGITTNAIPSKYQTYYNNIWSLGLSGASDNQPSAPVDCGFVESSLAISNWLTIVPGVTDACNIPVVADTSGVELTAFGCSPPVSLIEDAVATITAL